MRGFLFGLAGLGVLGAAGAALSQGGAKHPYTITPEVGPWTICVASFTGEESGKFAEKLVTELRTQYRLNAFFFNRADEERRQQDAELAARRRAREAYLRQIGANPAEIHLPVRRVRIEDQYAVLVGGFKDMDEARRELERIKKLPPPRSVPKDVVYEAPVDASAKGAKDQRREVNPFTRGLVVPNPTVPTAHLANKPDPFWKELNADESFSLLRCKKPWTLAIKEFHGAVVVQPQTAPSGFLEKLFGGKVGEQLSASAQNAHNLAEALRKTDALRQMGVEAYVLHTRGSSVVTVGAFDRPDDPRMAEVESVLSTKVKFYSKDERCPAGVELFIPPRPMPVPQF